MTNKLEQLLLNIESVQKLTEEQTKETLKTVLADETKKFIQESLLKEDDFDSEETVDSMGDDYSEEVVGADSNELPTDVDAGDMSDTTDIVSEPDMGDVGDMGDSDDMTTVSDDEVLDLTNASAEEVMAAIQNLPDDTVIEIRKNPATFDVSTDTDGLEESYDITESEDCEDCDDNDDNKLDEWIEESLQENVKKDVSKQYQKIISDYENKLQKLQEQLNVKNKEIQKLQEQEAKYENVLVESQNALEKLAIYNTNLMHVSKLLTEQTISKEEKTNILKQFDEVKTINESKILYNALASTLSKAKSSVITEEVQKIKGEIKDQRVQKVAEKQIIKEEKTYKNPLLARFDTLIGHKI